MKIWRGDHCSTNKYSVSMMNQAQYLCARLYVNGVFCFWRKHIEYPAFHQQPTYQYLVTDVYFCRWQDSCPKPIDSPNWIASFCIRKSQLAIFQRGTWVKRERLRNQILIDQSCQKKETIQTRWGLFSKNGVELFLIQDDWFFFNKDDPEYLAKRAKNNEAIKRSREKARQKVAHNNDNIVLLNCVPIPSPCIT